MNCNNLFLNIPEKVKKEIFEPIIKNKKFKLERIISQGQCTPEGKWLEQKNNEWVVLLSGKAKLKFEYDRASYLMEAGDYIHIPKGKRHRVEWTDPNKKTVWLALHYK